MLNGTGKGLRILKVRMGAGGVGMREETGKNGEYYGLSLGFSLAPVTTCTCVLLYSQQNNAIPLHLPDATDGADTVAKCTQRK